jgi:hypothetical protein
MFVAGVHKKSLDSKALLRLARGAFGTAQKFIFESL